MEQSLQSPRNPVADLTRILLPIFILLVAIGGSVWIYAAKRSNPTRPTEESKAPLVETAAVEHAPVKRKRGRPRKYPRPE